jgi:hypothetical protein
MKKKSDKQKKLVSTYSGRGLKRSPTQCARVLSHLEGGETLTALEALNKYGIMRLATRVFELKQLGYPIKTTFKSVINRYGEEVRVAVYSLKINDEGGSK